jgi:hypothetical protein
VEFVKQGACESSSATLMRNIATLFASLMLLAAQAASPVPQQAAASGEAPVSADVAVSLDTASAQPVKVTGPARPDFDQSQLAPLRAAQAKAAALAATRRRTVRRTTVTTASYVVRAQAPATPENMQALRFCESGNTYTRNSGNGYYGAYQYDLGTWGNFQGYARPDLAPASVQDAKFMETFNRRGWAPWPACSPKLGFM